LIGAPVSRFQSGRKCDHYDTGLKENAHAFDSSQARVFSQQKCGNSLPRRV
jgi:hypothetical protein